MTHMVSAPVIYERMIQAQIAKPREVSSLRALVSMGAPLEKESCLRCMKILCPGAGTMGMALLTSTGLPC